MIGISGGIGESPLNIDKYVFHAELLNCLKGDTPACFDKARPCSNLEVHWLNTKEGNVD